MFEQGVRPAEDTQAGAETPQGERGRHAPRPDRSLHEMCALERARVLHVENNDVLEGFCLDSLSQVDCRFRIAYNRTLPTCAAEALLQQVGPANIGGTITMTTQGSGVWV